MIIYGYGSIQRWAPQFMAMSTSSASWTVASTSGHISTMSLATPTTAPSSGSKDGFLIARYKYEFLVQKGLNWKNSISTANACIDLSPTYTWTKGWHNSPALAQFGTAQHGTTLYVSPCPCRGPGTTLWHHVRANSLVMKLFMQATSDRLVFF